MHLHAGREVVARTQRSTGNLTVPPGCELRLQPVKERPRPTHRTQSEVPPNKALPPSTNLIFVTWCLRIDRCCCHIPTEGLSWGLRTNANLSELTVDPQPHLHTHLGIRNGDAIFHIREARWPIARLEFTTCVQHPCPCPFTSRLRQLPVSFLTPSFD